MPIGIILGLKNVNMSYEHYDHNIVSCHMVKLNGWPAGLQRISPSKINTVEEIRSLRDALKAGDCMWSKLSMRQHTAHLESLAARIAADPSLAKPTKKARSDKGVRKKKVASGSNGKQAEVGGKRKHIARENEAETSEEDTRAPPAKKTKRPASKKAAIKGQLPPIPRSRSVISTTDDNE